MPFVRNMLFAAALATLGPPGIGSAQIVGVNLINAQGATAPCAGIGPVGEYCAAQFEKVGFVRTADAGSSGLTLGEAGDQDGVVTAVDSGSPAAQGVMVGDRLVSVDGRTIRSEPAAAAAQRLFGKRGDKVKLSVLRAGAPMELTLSRAPVAEPPGPTSTNALFGFHDLVDWRGTYIPCMGAGPAGFVAVNFCVRHFRSFGYVPIGDAGDVGLTLDADRDDAAVVKAVAPDSPASKAGMQSGDVIQAIDGAPVVATRAAEAKERLFGRTGETRRLRVRRGVREVEVALTLAGRSR